MSCNCRFGRRFDSINCRLVPTSNTPPPACVLIDSRDSGWERAEPEGMKSQPSFGLRLWHMHSWFSSEQVDVSGEKPLLLRLFGWVWVRCVGWWVGRKRWEPELGGTIERSPLICVSAASPAPSVQPPQRRPPGSTGREEGVGEGVAPSSESARVGSRAVSLSALEEPGREGGERVSMAPSLRGLRGRRASWVPVALGGARARISAAWVSLGLVGLLLSHS